MNDVYITAQGVFLPGEPIENEFMPTSTDIKKIKNNTKNAEILKVSRGIELYHSRDLEFNRPKASLIYKVRFPNNVNSLDNAVLMDYT